MAAPDARLGVNIDANKLYYAVSRPAKPDVIERIGAIDFSFDLVESVAVRDPETFPGLVETLRKLVQEHAVSRINMVLPPSFECWSIIPKSVFDEQKERTAHLNILMQGIDIQNTQIRWHQLSNRDFKMVSIRRNEHMESFTSLFHEIETGYMLSDFEIWNNWLLYSNFKGSFLALSSYNGILGISSYLLGKLRGATYITYDDLHDLPYLWLQYASHLPWIMGMHEQILLFGDHSATIVETLRPHWDDSSRVIIMNSLKKMNLKSGEDSFNFPLERAFPAALLSVS